MKERGGLRLRLNPPYELRLVDRFEGLAKYPACRDYVARATARPSFAKAHADQLAHFAAADAA
jgi:glutathione S-transferase